MAPSIGKQQVGIHIVPRDLLLSLDNVIIDCPGAMRARQYETTAYRDFLYEAMKGGLNGLVLRSRLLDESYQLQDPSIPTLVNKEIVFDALNVVRLGNDLLYLHPEHC